MAKCDSEYAGYGTSPDLEVGYGARPALYPGIYADENELRWGLIRKVYNILSIQVLLTAAVSAFVVFTPAALSFFAVHPWILFFASITPLILMCPLYYYRQQHPVNLVLLGLFTATISLSVGISCALTNGYIVLEALLLTAGVVLALTAYTLYAARKGHDFSFLGPILFTTLTIILLFGLIQVFFPLGPVSQMIYSGLTALLFSAYIVYDTDNLIKRYSYDEYIWASVALYLDILNLFLSLLQILRGMRDN
ncbi:BI1-like protein [Physcomitrium patens]|uniref:BI1-like protein n=1 Tax=Physcomitrium patens TaxID=3218 RepID=A9SQ31_PHYPA|nr:BI1-like protein [Physcomitrium patens]PNR56002.1 hypothetical protein PHYPA_006899 [Physcomitrium patens]|eukprot:XP_024373107.1 BI1-like protein [Physcomitrella patens]